MKDPNETPDWSRVVPPSDLKRPLVERVGLRFLPKDLRAQAEEPNPVAEMLMPSMLRRFAWILYVPWSILIGLTVLMQFVDQSLQTPQSIAIYVIVLLLCVLSYATVPILSLPLAVCMALGELRKKGMLEGMMASGLSGRHIVRALLFPFLLRHVTLLLVYISISAVTTVAGMWNDFGAVIEPGSNLWALIGTLSALMLLLLMLILNFWVLIMLPAIVASRTLCVKLIADPEEQSQRMWHDVALPAIVDLLLLVICCCIGLIIVYYKLQKPWKRTAALLDWAGDAMPDWVDVRGGKPADFPYAWTSDFTPKPPINER